MIKISIQLSHDRGIINLDAGLLNQCMFHGAFLVFNLKVVTL